jgi:hypothetical protein
MPSAQDILDAVNATRDRLGDQNGTSGGVNGRVEDVKGKLDATNNNLNDIKGKIDVTNNDLNDIKGKLDTLDTAIKAVDADVKVVQQLLTWGFQQLITLGQYTNQALFQNDKQNDTMICILQQIAVNTCGIWNEDHMQTGLQTSIKDSTTKLADLFADTHAAAELARQEREHLREEIEKCCPPTQPAPVCVEAPCPAPPPFVQPPPQTEPPPDIGPDLDSILVRPSGTSIQFSPEATLNTGDKWDFQVNLTGPAVDPTFLISLKSSDPNDAPVAAATQLKKGDTSGTILGGKATNPSSGVIDVTISATGKRMTKTATLHIQPPPK